MTCRYRSTVSRRETLRVPGLLAVGEQRRLVSGVELGVETAVGGATPGRGAGNRTDGDLLRLALDTDRGLR
jgi:hypothetical protein